MATKFYEGAGGRDFDPAFDDPDDLEPEESKILDDDQWLTTQINAEQWLNIDVDRFWDMNVDEWNRTLEVGMQRHKFLDLQLGRLQFLVYLSAGGRGKQLQDFLVLHDSTIDDDEIFDQIAGVMSAHGIPEQTET